MKKTVVILQPQYLPWGGVFEQVRLADVYVHYDDVQFPQGRSFTNRVQIKTEQGPAWMTVPVQHEKLTAINATAIDYNQRWQHKHLERLHHAYAKAPFGKEALGLARQIIEPLYENIAELNIAGIEKVARYLGFETVFMRSSQMGIGGASTARLVDLCSHLGADTYVTGMGARNYVDYDQFENASIRLTYMDYKKNPWKQEYGDFTPFVSILDLIAHCGKDGASLLNSGTIYWRDLPPVQESA